MGILKKIFGIDTDSENSNADNDSLDVKSFDLNSLADIDIRKAKESIKKQRKKNLKKFDANYEKAKKLIQKGRSDEAQELTSKDVLGYHKTFAKAQSLEKEENLKEAAIIYWFNIYENGTDAPANFNRLLIILRKLKLYKAELSIALIFSDFVKNKNKGKLDRRINTIKNK